MPSPRKNKDTESALRIGKNSPIPPKLMGWFWGFLLVMWPYNKQERAPCSTRNKLGAFVCPVCAWAILNELTQAIICPWTCLTPWANTDTLRFSVSAGVEGGNQMRWGDGADKPAHPPPPWLMHLCALWMFNTEESHMSLALFPPYRPGSYRQICEGATQVRGCKSDTSEKHKPQCSLDILSTNGVWYLSSFFHFITK